MFTQQDLNELSAERLVAAYEKKGYPVFRGDNKDLNLGVIRSDVKQSNKFDDFIYYFYLEGGKWVIKKAWCTADPGAHYLKNPMAQGGAAIIKEGFYRGAFSVDFIHGTKGLRQQIPLPIYRDDNRDLIIDLNPSTLQSGMYGIFIHEHLQRVEKATLVHNSSAGCIVPELTSFMKSTIKDVEESSKFHGTRVSFALLTEKEYR